MPSAAPANRRFLILLYVALAFLFFTFVGFFRHHDLGVGYSNAPIHKVSVADSTLRGASIMGKLGNETLKY